MIRKAPPGGSRHRAAVRRLSVMHSKPSEETEVLRVDEPSRSLGPARRRVRSEDLAAVHRAVELASTLVPIVRLGRQRFRFRDVLLYKLNVWHKVPKPVRAQKDLDEAAWKVHPDRLDSIPRERR